MLEEKELRKELHKKKLSLVVENYGVVTHFMPDYQIPYYEIYVDLL